MPTVAPLLDAMNCYDAHNHLQDDRFADRRDTLLAEARSAGVRRMVVNGSCEEDWPMVASLADANPDLILPAFGYHPWYVHLKSRGWHETLEGWLASQPEAVLGEIGLDRWILDQSPAARARICPSLAGREPATMAVQEEVFVWQLRLAAERNLPVTIHCLQAWGRLQELLRKHPRPAAGFLLHSFGGPVEMIDAFAKLGAYFSFPGYFAHERKQRQRETFLRVPADRLLIETDAPDQLPPDALITHPLPSEGSDRPLNHPANLPSIQGYVADLLGVPAAEFASRLEANFLRLFGPGAPGA
jgi:TatD DNase family protein